MALKDYFFFTKEERHGVLLLLVIISTIIGVKVTIAAVHNPQPNEQPTATNIVNTKKTAVSSGNYRHYNKREVGTIELNTADTILLQELKGIGPGFARRIFKYREQLGGFYAKEQLLEVYGFSDSLYNLIKERITVDETKIRKRNINTESISTLKRHPYISYYEARAIIEYRDGKRNRKVEDITELSILPDLQENWEIIQLYICAE
ncbi:MAG: helix-hairpin-helix domain-containing protein [Paludibacteraceae bacterium]|nr:helix-hairpin-helix domain-containing protein [Paludibacteraceae bacterium]